jgi:hypothetical protein
MGVELRRQNLKLKGDHWRNKTQSQGRSGYRASEDVLKQSKGKKPGNLRPDRERG